jgi:spermidine synthase
MNLLDAPSVILACGAIGGLAGLAFGWRLPVATRAAHGCTALLLLVLALGNSSSSRLIRPMIVKGRVSPATNFLFDRWNALSRVTVEHPTDGPPQYWAPARNAPRAAVVSYGMTIDGEAGTVVRRFRDRADIEHLRYDLPNMAYHIRPRGGACIIGIGGGRDLQSALLFGHEHVTGVDINPTFVSLLQHEFREFAGLAGNPAVTLVADDARSYLSRSEDKFAVIQMSLIDTWAATGAGAYSLTENSLYTLQAWQAFLQRLTDDGLFTVSRWYDPKNLGETGRLISLAVSSVLSLGLEPSEHIALITSDNLATLVLSKRPLEPKERDRLEQVAQQYGFETPILPGRPIPDAIMRELVSARSRDDLQRTAAAYPLQIGPTTDESPYFFNILKLDHLDFWKAAGVVRGNLVATVALVSLVATLLIITAATVVVPLWLKRLGNTESRQPPQWSAALYFALIGCCFMLVEIGAIQRLSVLLSHPSYALGVLLFSLILSSGVGSMLSEHLPLTRRPWVGIYPLVCVATILLVNAILNLMLSRMLYASLGARVVASVLVIFPLGICLGMFFPAGMRLIRSPQPDQTPWYWALNGTCSVLCSALAVLISIYGGISMNLYIAAAGYALTLPCAWNMSRDATSSADAAASRQGSFSNP